MNDAITAAFESARPELRAYLCRLVIRPQVADELVQTTYLRCFEASERLPDSTAGCRAWFFKVATNLAFDELRRHSSWRESTLDDLRGAAEADAALVAGSLALAGTPETRAIAREHLVACLACSLRNLPESRAAALLLKEVHGFTIDEIAELLEASAGQVKNWLQEARRHMERRYGSSCALIAKQGVCDQCSELAGFFRADAPPRIDAGAAGIDARLKFAADMRAAPWGRWHRTIFALLDDLE